MAIRCCVVIVGSTWHSDDVISGRAVSMHRADEDDAVIDVVGCETADCDSAMSH